MSQTQRISKNNTNILIDGENSLVTLHKTIIVKVSPKEITLNSGGWLTATTRTRMNQVANEWGLNYHVSQVRGKWYVTAEIAGIKQCSDFFDGMTIPRGGK